MENDGGDHNHRKGKDNSKEKEERRILWKKGKVHSRKRSTCKEHKGEKKEDKEVN